MADSNSKSEHHYVVMRETTGGAVGGREQVATKVGTFDTREDANEAARGALNTNDFASVEVSESKTSGLAIVTGERADGNEEEVFVVEERDTAATEALRPER